LNELVNNNKLSPVRTPPWIALRQVFMVRRLLDQQLHLLSDLLLV